MKKTISINLGGYNFYIEETAYAKLDSYLSAVKTTFSKFPDSQEIVTDMESRLAEHFQSSGAGKESRVITDADVDQMIALMGTVQDFAAEEGTIEKNTSKSDDSTAEPTVKRLYRNPDDTMIAGVCSGIAAYFGVDPTFIRIIFLVGLFFGGFSILAYIILMIVMPEAKTATEKMKMHGQPLTLAAIEETVRKQLSPDPETVTARRSTFMKIIRFPFLLIGRVFSFLTQRIIPLIGKIAGLAAIVVTSVMIAGLTIALVTIITNIHSPYWDIPLSAFITTPLHYLLLVCIFFLILIPIIFIQQLGIYFFSRRKLHATMTVGLFFVWFAALSVGGALFIRFLPAFESTYRDLPQVRVVEKEMDISSFKDITVGDTYAVTIVPGTEYALSASGPERGLDRILVTTTSDGVLKITTKPRMHTRCIFWCGDWERTTVTITTPILESITATDAARIEAAGFTSPHFSVTASDVSRVILSLTSTQVTTTLRDASRVTLSGTTTDLHALLHDVSRLEARDFSADAVTVTTHDASRAAVYALQQLTATAHDVSRVTFLGEPETSMIETDVARIISEIENDEQY